MISISLGLLLGSTYFREFSPAILFEDGQQGLWYDPSDLTTMYQTNDTSTPVTAAGQTVGLWLDKSGNENNASNATAAQRPLYQDTPSRLVLDKVDDRLIVSTGGFVGTMVLSTELGTVAYEVNIPAGDYQIGGRGGLYYPGTALIGQIIRNGSLLPTEISDSVDYLRERGGGLNYGGVTNFDNFWRNWSELTSFPEIDSSSATRMLNTWRGCSSLTSFPVINTSLVTNINSAWDGCLALTSFPILDTSSVTTFSVAWRNCSSLTSFPLLNVSLVTTFLAAWQGCTSLVDFPPNFFDGCAATNFNNAFLNTNLSQSSIDGILTSINSNLTSGGSFIQSGGSAPSAVGQAAIDDLRGRGWTITVTGGY